ncbi:MAG: hypothetical protein FJ029_01200 [Actinobacteria bacterium]|nr:hypothetical protein [Actinomycetota bacterium]
MTIRSATVDDGVAYGSVWDSAEPDGAHDLASWAVSSPLFEHEVRTGTAVVAETGGRIQGLAAVFDRGDALYLSGIGGAGRLAVPRNRRAAAARRPG